MVKKDTGAAADADADENHANEKMNDVISSFIIISESFRTDAK